MSDRTHDLIETLRALAEVQRNKQTYVNNELHAVLKELMHELKLQ